MSADSPERMNAAKARRSLRNGLITLVLMVALAAGLILAVPGLSGVLNTLSRMNGWWIAAAAGFEILSCASYVIAFLQVFDRAPFRFGARVALSELAFGAAVSIGGAGSVAVGAWLLVERGAPTGRVAERSAILFLYTSAINVFTLAIAGLALFAGVPGPSNPLLSLIPGVVGVIVLILFMALPRNVDRIAAKVKPGKFRTLLTETSVTVRETERLIFHPDWRLLGAVGFLWFDIGCMYAVFLAAGHAPPLAPLVLAYQIAYLSNFIPIPGGIGVLDGSMVGMLVLYGIPGTVATAATLVYHAISLWIPAMWGTIAFIVLQKTKQQPIVPRHPREEQATRR